MCTVKQFKKYKKQQTQKEAKHKRKKIKQKSKCAKKVHCVKEWEAKTGHFYFSGAGHHKTDAGPGSYHNADDDDDLTGDDDDDDGINDDDDDVDVEREIFSKSEGE